MRNGWRLLQLTAAHLALLGAFLWAESASRYNFALEVTDRAVVAYLEGREAGRIAVPPGQAGGIALELLQPRPTMRWITQAMPRQSWRTVRVVEADTGRILLQEDFADPDLPGWEILRGEPRVRGGGIFSRGPLLVTTGDESWSAYRVEAELRHGWNAGIEVLRKDHRHRVQLRFGRFRVHGGKLTVFQARLPVAQNRLDLRPGVAGRVAALVARLLRVYFLALLAGGALLAVVTGALRWLVGRPGSSGWGEGWGSSRWVRRISRLLPWAMAATATGSAAGLSLLMLEGIPQVQDSIVYLFQAKILASGRLWVPPPELLPAFRYRYMLVHDGRMFAQYGFGWPLLLAVGVLVRAPWLVNPVLSGLSLLLLVRLGTALYDRETGLAAGLLGLVSPFFLLMGATHLSHPAALFYNLLALVAALEGRGTWLKGMAAGFFLALVAACRPMTALPMGCLIAAILTSGLLRRREGAWRRALFALLGLACGVALILGNNAALTGHPLVTGYDLTLGEGMIGSEVGLGGRNPPVRALTNVDVLLRHLMYALFRWPAFLTLTPLMLTLLQRRIPAPDRLLWAGFLGTVGCYFFFYNSGICFGPRYYYEALPFLLLLAVRGIRLTLDAAGRWAGRGDPSRAAVVESLLPRVRWIVFGLILMASVRDPRGYERVFRDLRYQYEVPASILRAVQSRGLEKAVVFVPEGTGGARWQAYGSVFPQNSPDFDGPVVYARSRGERPDWQVLRRYPDRAGYLASFPEGELVPYDPLSRRPATAPSSDPGGPR